MKTLTKTVTLLLLVAAALSVDAQVADSVIAAMQANKFEQRKSLFEQTETYLHIDKSVYTRNENIWLKAYILRFAGSPSLQHTLFVALSDRVSHKIVCADKFVIENGFSAGTLTVPDSAKAGEYNLIAYTNTFSSEKHPFIFQQQISIREARTEKYNFTIENTSPDSSSFIVKIRNNEKLYPKNAGVLYRIFSNDSLMSTGKRVVNDYGEINIPTSDAAAENAELEMLIVNGKDSFLTKRRSITFLDNNIKIKWFPEGGGLADRITGRIAFEATTLSGRPAAISGTLYEDGKPAAKLQANAAGLGIISLAPGAAKRYSVKLDNDQLKVQSLNFPEVSKSAYVLSAAHGVADDSLLITMQGLAESKVHLLIHNYESIIGMYDLALTGGKFLFAVNVSSMAPQLLTLTLLDSTGMPCAERTVLVGLANIPSLDVQADSAMYHKRSRISLKLLAADKEGNPLAGNYSLAFVHKPRVNMLTSQSIVAYSLFNNYIQHGLADRIGMFNTGSKDELEMMLLTRFWVRYKEPAITPGTEIYAAGSVTDETGYVLENRRNIKSLVKITILGSTGINEFYTNSNGSFIIPKEMLIASPGEKLILMAGDNKQAERYQIIFHHLSDSLQQKLASLSFSSPVQTKAVIQEPQAQIIPGTKTLETAVVSTKKNEQVEEFRSKSCADWVCMYNILNCPNHPTGTPPVEGAIYIYRGHDVIYRGCASDNEYAAAAFARIKGRYYTREFYKTDYSRLTSSEPELQSTVFWNPQIITDAAGKAETDFYTNDLLGNFLIIVQGITEKGPAYSIKEVKVAE